MEPIEHTLLRDPTCGYGHGIEVFQIVERIDANTQTELDTEPARCGEQTVDNGLRILRGGKDALVGLNGKGYAMVLKPTLGIGRTEGIEEPLDEPMTTRVDVLEVDNVSKGVGAVASAAARNGHLGQNSLLAFQNNNVGLR